MRFVSAPKISIGVGIHVFLCQTVITEEYGIKIFINVLVQNSNIGMDINVLIALMELFGIKKN